MNMFHFIVRGHEVSRMKRVENFQYSIYIS